MSQNVHVVFIVDSDAHCGLFLNLLLCVMCDLKTYSVTLVLVSCCRARVLVGHGGY